MWYNFLVLLLGSFFMHYVRLYLKMGTVQTVRVQPAAKGSKTPSTVSFLLTGGFMNNEDGDLATDAKTMLLCSAIGTGIFFYAILHMSIGDMLANLFFWLLLVIIVVVCANMFIEWLRKRD